MLSINPKTLYVRNRKTGKFVPLVAIIGPPGSIDNITDYLTNETGDSEELAMSQKGATLLLAAVVTELEKTKSELKYVRSSLEYLYGDGTLGLVCRIEDNTCAISGINQYCQDTDIVVPKSICFLPVTKIGYHAFSERDNLTSIKIPNSVTSIEYSAFAACTGLTSIEISDSVKSIGFGAFSGCNSLTDIYYRGTEAEWDAIDIDAGNEIISTATIHFRSSLPRA